MTSTVRYSRSQLLSVDRYATSDARSRLTCCVNLLLRQLCIFKRFSTRRKHRGWRKIAKQIETIIHCARVPTLPQRSRNVHNLITLPLCKQVSKTRDQGVRVCYVNAQSCRNKTLAIADHILDNQLDMMAISETWLKSSRDSNVIKDIVPNGYCIKHTPRPTGKGGGVAIIHKSEIVLHKQDTDAFRSFEHIECRLKTPVSSMRIVVFYRPPPSAKNGLTTTVFFDEWDRFIDQHTIKPGPLIIMGDLNIHIDNTTNADARRLINSVNATGMVLHVREPTHRKGHMLDVLMTRSTDEHLVRNVTITDMGLSDHFAVNVNINIVQRRTGLMKIRYRKTRAIDTVFFRRDIPLFSSNDLDALNVEELVDQYDKLLVSLVDSHAPMLEKQIRLRQDTVWYTDDLRVEKRTKRQRERSWRKSRLEVNRQLYADQCKRVNALLTETKCAYYSSKIRDTGKNQQRLYRIVNCLLHRKVGTMLPTYTSEAEMAGLFASHFSEKISNICRELSLSSDGTNGEKHVDINNCCTSKLSSFVLPTPDEIKTIVMDAPPKSCNLDPAPTWLVKDTINELLPIVSHIVVTSLQSSVMPEKYKTSYISPLLKKIGLNPESLLNYRPISNLPFISKVIERVVAKQLSSHTGKITLPRRRWLRSTMTFYVLSIVVVSLCWSCLTWQPLSRPSTIPFFWADSHRFGVTGAALEWFRSYLSGRHQVVRIGNEKSPPKDVTFGVPQGSVLGPLLFTAYITPVGDIIKKFGLDYHLYADDTQLYVSFAPGGNNQLNSMDRLYSCLQEICEWSRTNLLKINEHKTDVIVFGTKQKLPTLKDFRITVGDTTRIPSSSVRNFGVIFDSSLSMTSNISTICRTAYMHLHNISHIRRYLTIDATKALVHAFVTSRLDYGNALLIGLPRDQINKLQRIQNMAARVITFTPRRDHMTPVLKDLHWLPVKCRIEYKILLHVYRCLNGMAPLYLANLLKRQSPGRTRSSEQHLLDIPRTKLASFGDRSFRVMGPRLWNALPIVIKCCGTLSAFRKALKTHIFKAYYCWHFKYSMTF